MTVYYERKEWWTVVFGSYSWALAWVCHFIYRDMDWEGGKLLSNALDVLRWRRGCKRGRMRRSQGSVVLVVVVIAINRLAFLDYLFH